MCTSAPDTSGMNKAAEMQASTADKALEWYQQQYRDSEPDRKAAAAAALEQAGTQNQLAKLALQTSQQERQRYQSTFQPIEEKIASDAMAYDTPQRREAAARQAQADTEIALSRAAQSSRQAMERRGVTPNYGRELALQGAQDIALAKAKAGAANFARNQVQTVGAAKLADAAGLGRGVISNQTTQAQLGLTAGNSSVGNSAVPVTLANQGAQLGGQGFSTAIQGYGGAANTYGKIAGIESGVDAANGQQMQQGAATVATIAIAI